MKGFMNKKQCIYLITVVLLGISCSFVRPTVSLLMPLQGTRTPLATIDIKYPPTTLPEVTNTPPAPTPTVPTPTVPLPTVEIPRSATLNPKEEYEKVDSPGYSRTVRVVAMDGDPCYTAPFNDAVDLLVKTEFDAFLQGVTSNEDWRMQVIPDMTSSFDVQSTVIYNDRSLVSVLFSFYLYAAGAVHPLTYSKTINYDLLQARVLNLSDLFVPGSNWLDVISSYSTDYFYNWGLLDYPGGVGPNESNFKNWILDDRGITFYIDPYQITAYAAGPQNVTIPFTETALESVTAKPGILDRMISQ